MKGVGRASAGAKPWYERIRSAHVLSQKQRRRQSTPTITPSRPLLIPRKSTTTPPPPPPTSARVFRYKLRESDPPIRQLLSSSYEPDDDEVPINYTEDHEPSINTSEREYVLHASVADHPLPAASGRKYPAGGAQPRRSPILIGARPSWKIAHSGTSAAAPMWVIGDERQVTSTPPTPPEQTTDAPPPFDITRHSSPRLVETSSSFSDSSSSAEEKRLWSDLLADASRSDDDDVSRSDDNIDDVISALVDQESAPAALYHYNDDTDYDDDDGWPMSASFNTQSSSRTRFRPIRWREGRRALPMAVNRIISQSIRHPFLERRLS